MKYEYLAVNFSSTEKFTTGVNKLAGDGWELINGASSGGFAFYAFLRRLLPT